MSKYSTYGSDFLSYTIDNEKGKIAFFGIESGGRDRDKHASYNLMLPGYGGIAGSFKRAFPTSQEITEASASFKNANGSVSYNMKDTRTLEIALDGVDKNDIFSTRLSIKTAPPTIWTKNEPKHLKSRNPYTIYKSRFELPLIVHLAVFTNPACHKSSFWIIEGIKEGFVEFFKLFLVFLCLVALSHSFEQCT